MSVTRKDAFRAESARAYPLWLAGESDDASETQSGAARKREQQLRQNLTVQPDSIRHWSALAHLQMERGEERRARRSFRQLLSCQASTAAEHFQQALACAALHEAERGLRCWQAGADQAPELAPHYLGLQRRLRELSCTSRTTGLGKRFGLLSVFACMPALAASDAWTASRGLAHALPSADNYSIPKLQPLSPVAPEAPASNASAPRAASAPSDKQAASKAAPASKKNESKSLLPFDASISAEIPILDKPILGKRPTSEKYNIRYGRVGIDLTAFAKFEFNDNISANDEDIQSDLIVSSGINFATTVDISKSSSITFNAGAAFKKYFRNSELDSADNFLTLDQPDTGFSFDADIDTDTAIRIYDKVGFSLDPTDTQVPAEGGGFQVGIVKFSRFTNTLGATTGWRPNKRLQITADVSRHDVLPQDFDFDFTRSVTYRMNLSSEYALKKNLTTGASIEYFTRDYTRSTNDFSNNDGDGFTLGPKFEWRVNDRTVLTFRGGYTAYSFDSNGTNSDTDETETLVFDLTLENQLNANYGHSLRLARSARFGLTNNTQVLNQLAYAFSWKMMRAASLNGSLGVEDVEDSGPTGEEFTRYIGSLGFGYRLNKKTTMDVKYTYITKDSDTAGRGYDQNRVVLGFNYDF